jgi:hypothetical protein
MNPLKLAASLLLTIPVLLLIGCEGMLPTESNPPGAVVPNLPPGAEIPGGLRIVSAHATPLVPDFVDRRKGTVSVRFNGAATTAGEVKVEAQSPDWMSSMYTSAGEAKFVPGQTDVQVPITVTVKHPARIPLKVRIRGSSAEFQTMTHYSGDH